MFFSFIDLLRGQLLADTASFLLALLFLQVLGPLDERLVLREQLGLLFVSRMMLLIEGSQVLLYNFLRSSKV